MLTEAEHLCMKMRGVKNDAKVSSMSSRGIYENNQHREEVLSVMKHRKIEPSTLNS